MPYCKDDRCKILGLHEEHEDDFLNVLKSKRGRPRIHPIGPKQYKRRRLPDRPYTCDACNGTGHAEGNYRGRPRTCRVCSGHGTLVNPRIFKTVIEERRAAVPAPTSKSNRRK